MPRRWAFLAVTLATIAVVAAVAKPPAGRAGRAPGEGPSPHPGDFRSQTTPAHPATRPKDQAGPATGPAEGSPGATSSAGPRATDADPERPVSMGGPPMSDVVGSSPVAVPAGNDAAAALRTGAAPPSSPTSSTDGPSTDPTSTAESGTARVTEASASPAAAVQTDPGNLEYPDNVSAAYPIDVITTGFRVTATWVGAPILSLSIDCPDGWSGSSGPTGLSVTATGVGNCVVTLAEPASTDETVSYTLSIDSSGT